MRIWTIQTAAAWADLNKHQYLQARRHHQSDLFPEVYGWMEAQVIRRVGPPPHPDAVPLWGWYQWDGAARSRPDLRVVRHGWGPPGDYVLLECELPDSAVVLSDFHAWNCILNSGYFESSADDEAAYLLLGERHDAAPSEESAEALRTMLHRSWERVIDMDLLVEPDWFAMENKAIQGCFWQITRDQVMSCKTFRSL